MAWNKLTDEERQAVVESLPNGVAGYLKEWGWLHFASAIEAKCREKNERPERGEAEFEVYTGDCLVAGASGPRASALAEARNYALQYLDESPVVRIEEVTRTVAERFMRELQEMQGN